MHGIAYLGLNKVLKIRKGPGRFLRLAQTDINNSLHLSASMDDSLPAVERVLLLKIRR